MRHTSPQVVNTIVEALMASELGGYAPKDVVLDMQDAIDLYLGDIITDPSQESVRDAMIWDMYVALEGVMTDYVDSLGRRYYRI